MVAIAALGMLLVLATMYIVQRDQAEDRVRAELLSNATGFRDLVQDPDLTGGAAPTSVYDALYLGIRMENPTDHEGFLGIVEGPGDPPDLMPPTATIDLAGLISTEPELRAALEGLDRDGPVRLREIDTDAGRLWFIAIPVDVAGDPNTGIYLTAMQVDQELAHLHQATLISLLTVLASLVLLGSVAFLVADRVLAPLRDLDETARTIGDTDLSQRIPVQRLDEVGRLTGTINSMLDRLQASFDLQRTFLDDAGHELRTPVTVLRGHLELMQADDPHDVTSTQELTLDELDRMERIIEDLVVLAKAGRPDFVRRAPTALEPLVTSILDKARALGDRHWVLDGTVDATAELDAQRIEQAMLQLLSNATRYTPGGREIGIGARLTGGGELVELWVRDQGIGLRPGQEEKVFDRFHRGGDDAAATGHSGLGLAIVAAIAEAHGGRAAAQNNRDGGAIFRLVLPRGRAAEEEPEQDESARTRSSSLRRRPAAGEET